MPTISTTSAKTRRSSSPAGDCRLPDTGDDLRSQPTLSRLEHAPRLRDVIDLTYALVDAWMDSYPRPPRSVTLDIRACPRAFSHGVLDREAKNPREDFTRIKRALLARDLACERDGLTWPVVLLP